MKQHALSIRDCTELLRFLVTPAFRAEVQEAATILVQVYSASGDPAWIGAILELLAEHLPGAVVAGATTIGEIAQGRTLASTTAISFTLFTTSRVTAILEPAGPGADREAGRRIGQAIADLGPEVAGALLLATTNTMDASELLLGMAEGDGSYPIFGGGAGGYGPQQHALVFLGRQVTDCGVVALALAGPDLQVEAHHYLGWRPMTREMRITATDGMWVQTVDGIPAFEVYRRYLGIANDPDFFLNTLEFPFLLERQGQGLARVPFAAGPAGALRFVGDIFEGERFRLGYGDPTAILAESIELQRKIRAAQPQGIFLYSCICRRFLLQDDSELETLPFEGIAPTTGFYTFGEFFGRDRELRVLNATLVAVAIREGPPAPEPAPAPGAMVRPAPGDPLAHKHSRVVDRLVHFVGAVTAELEEANDKLRHLSVTDDLSGLNNRLLLDRVFRRELARIARYPSSLAIILLDVDHFKQVNDGAGHLAGDAVLVHLAGILRAHVRVADTLGRWGGDEFLFILSHASADEARMVAETLRSNLAASPALATGPITCSYGITAFRPGDTVTTMMRRADAALYAAKQAGRDRVCVG
jgi:diguanylate cyclase (GGDEF)-like protein